MKKLITWAVGLLGGTSIYCAGAEAEKINTALLFQPRQSSKPSRTLGGATRNIERCGKNPTVSFVGIREDRPTIVWRLASHTAPQAEVALFDQNGKAVYQTTIPLLPTLQEVAITLPQNLAGNQEYKWVFSLVCRPQERLQDQTIVGWIEYVPVN